MTDSAGQSQDNAKSNAARLHEFLKTECGTDALPGFDTLQWSRQGDRWMLRVSSEANGDLLVYPPTSGNVQGHFMCQSNSMPDICFYMQHKDWQETEFLQPFQSLIPNSGNKSRYFWAFIKACYMAKGLTEAKEFDFSQGYRIRLKSACKKARLSTQSSLNITTNSSDSSAQQPIDTESHPDREADLSHSEEAPHQEIQSSEEHLDKGIPSQKDVQLHSPQTAGDRINALGSERADIEGDGSVSSPGAPETAEPPINRPPATGSRHQSPLSSTTGLSPSKTNPLQSPPLEKDCNVLTYLDEHRNHEDAIQLRDAQKAALEVHAKEVEVLREELKNKERTAEQLRKRLESSEATAKESMSNMESLKRRMSPDELMDLGGKLADMRRAPKKPRMDTWIGKTEEEDSVGKGSPDA